MEHVLLFIVGLFSRRPEMSDAHQENYTAFSITRPKRII
jgi:hypothetical protein